jgi:hypothetical protein
LQWIINELKKDIDHLKEESSESSQDDDDEGEDDEHEENPIEIEFQFTRNDMESIKLGIKECEDTLGEFKSMLDYFFEKESGYNIPQMCKYLGCDEDKTEILLEKYARLELGVKIKACVEEKGQCCFSGEF